MNAINETLVNYPGPVKNITYYDMGYINEMHTAITQIDCTNKKVVSTDSIISFDDLVKLEDA